MAEWLEDHVAAIGPFKLEPWNLCLMSDKMETGQGQLGGVSGTLRREGWGECCDYSEVFVW
jgi:hypothetical protein